MSELLLRARLLPVPHGFSTRAGGVSDGPYASLNLSTAVGDDPAAVAENVRRLLEAGGVEGIATANQVHGDRVLTPPKDARDPLTPVGEADALITSHPRQAVGVRTADCVPILLVDPVGRQVAAVHSGWRGTHARIVARAVEAMVARGAKAERVLAAIGPAIRGCCYEVSPELAQTFTQAFGSDVVTGRADAPHLELVAAVAKTLRGAGVREVEEVSPCTHCEADRFFSHRRDAGRTGRHLSFAACSF